MEDVFARKASWKALGVGSLLLVLLACACPFSSASTSSTPTPVVASPTPLARAATSACMQEHPHCYAATRYQNAGLAGVQVSISGVRLNCTSSACLAPCVAGDCTTDSDFIDNETWLGDDSDAQRPFWVEAGYGTFRFSNQVLTYSFWGDKRFPVAGRSDCVGSGIFVIFPVAPITQGQTATVAITRTPGQANAYDIHFTGSGSQAGSTLQHSSQNCMQAKYTEIGEETYGDRRSLSSSDGTNFTNATYTDNSGASQPVPDSGTDVTLLNDVPPSGYWDSGIYRVRQCCN